MHAEAAYLFRHALLRDAAYELHTMTDRATLHAAAFDLIVLEFGGELPECEELNADDRPAHKIDGVAAELAMHARNAIACGDDSTQLRGKLLAALRRAAEHATRNYRHAEAVALWRELGDNSAADVQGWALARAGKHAFMSGQPQQAEELMTAALSIARELGLRALEARACSGLGSVLRQTVRGKESGRYYEQALEIERELDDKKQLAGDLGNYGLYCESHGQLERAEACCFEALALAREVGDHAQTARALGQLGNLFRDTGRMEKALAYTRESLRIAVTLGQLPQQALQLESLGVWQAISGELDAAAISFREAQRMYTETGNTRALGIVLANIGNLFLEAGELDQAEIALHRALEIHREVGNVSFMSNTLASLGTSMLRRGEAPQALECFEEAVALLPYSGSLVANGAVRCARGICLAALGRTDEAREEWGEGTRVLRELGNLHELERQATLMRAVCANAGAEPFNVPEQKAEPRPNNS